MKLLKNGGKNPKKYTKWWGKFKKKAPENGGKIFKRKLREMAEEIQKCQEKIPLHRK